METHSLPSNKFTQVKTVPQIYLSKQKNTDEINMHEVIVGSYIIVLYQKLIVGVTPEQQMELVVNTITYFVWSFYFVNF